MRTVWKGTPRLTGVLLIAILAVTNGQTRQVPRLLTTTAELRISNRVVAAQVNSAGLFSIGTADNRPLLYDFPHTDYRSHLNVWLDGRLFSNEPIRTGLPALALLQAPTLLADSTLRCEYGIAELRLEQRLRHEQYTDSTGAIFVQYLLTNADSVAHEAGLLLELDTKVHDNDKTPFLTNFGYSDAERVFRRDSIPDFLQAFETLPPQPGLVAKFTLAGAAATLPDFVAIGDWINLSKAQWDYAKSAVPYNDSAVLLRWDPIILQPGESRTLGTYYGVGEVTSRTDTLTLSVIAPNQLVVQGDTLSPNPFSVSAFVTNTGFATAHNVRARIVLPEPLQLYAGETAVKEIAPRDLISQASGSITWKVQARCLPTDSNFNLKVEVSSDDAPGNAVTRALFVPACLGSGFALALQPRTQSLVAGNEAQVRAEIKSRGNFNEAVALEVWPTLPGIETTLTPPRVHASESALIRFATRNTLLPGEYRFVVYARSGSMQVADTLTLQINAALIDTKPPYTRGHNPAIGARNVLPETAITVEVLDESAGIDTTALVMLINETRVRPEVFVLDKNHVRLHYQPPLPFHYNERVRVTLRARDLANPPHEMPEEQYTFAMVEDIAPPLLTDISPARGATQIAPNTALAFHLRDDLAGVNADSIWLIINEVRVTPEISGSARDLQVRHQPARPFALNTQVSVRIRAQDLSLPPNVMPEERYTFTVVQDLAAPYVADLQPARDAQRVATNTQIAFHLRDEISGVDSNTIALTINGVAVRPQVRGALQNLAVQYQPSVPFRKGETVQVSIAAQDLSSPPNAMPREQYSFRIEEPVYDLIAENLRPLNAPSAGVVTFVAGEVRNALDALLQPVHVVMLADGAVIKDTLLVTQQAGQRTTLRAQVRFGTAGQHELRLTVDDDNRIAELSKNNNQQSLFVEIAPALVRELRVRPNPFTPNNDGYNDAVEFNFSTLTLQAPALRIFDVEGLTVVQEDNLHTGVFVWRGIDRNGRALPPGLYLYSLQDRGKNIANGYVVLAR